MTTYNQPAKWFEITATPEQLKQGRHLWKINHQHIPATPFIQTAAPPPTPRSTSGSDLLQAIDLFQTLNPTRPFLLTVHTTRLTQAQQVADELHSTHRLNIRVQGLIYDNADLWWLEPDTTHDEEQE